MDVGTIPNWTAESVGGYKPYEDHDNPLRLPTWAYKWDVVSEFSSDPIAAYKTYTNEFDLITAEQVNFSIL